MKVILSILLLGIMFLLCGCGPSDEEIMTAYKVAKEEATKQLNKRSQEEIVAIPFCEYDNLIKQEEKGLFDLLNGLHSDSLKSKEVRRLKLEMDGQRFFYAWSLRNVKKERMDVDPDFVEYARSLDMNDPVLIQDDLGVRVCDMRLRWEQAITPTTWKEKQLGYLAVIQKFITNQQVKNKMSTVFIESYLNWGGSERIKEVFARYLEICDDRETIDRLTPRYEELTVLSEGSQAPDFEMEDPQGKRCRLSDFRGKYVMIDAWATWCGPCKAEIPSFEKQYELFANDSRICFISISLDEDKEAWKKMLDEDKPQWKQYVVEGGILKSELCRKYFINAIPRFLFIDPQGKIISVSVVNPSDEAFTAFVREYLPA